VSQRYTQAEQQTLLDIARLSITHGLQQGRPLSIALDELTPALREPRATFVTLFIDGKLRGCIGGLEARLPLAMDVAQHALAAATHDPRFPPVTPEEAPQLSIHLSVLNPPEPMSVADEVDLLQQLRPGVDGLVLIDGRHHATFLPDVWEGVPDARAFLHHLKHKAGLKPDYWSDTIRFERYTTESIE